jgi:hypothetical protein
MENNLNKKVRGFEFKGGPGFTIHMQARINQIGTIKSCNERTYLVRFDDGGMYNYPYPEILEHLVDVKPIDLDDILEQIKNLRI